MVPKRKRAPSRMENGSDLMREIDNAKVGRDAIHDAFAESDGVVDDAEIGHEDDSWRRLHGGLLRRERAREVRRSVRRQKEDIRGECSREVVCGVRIGSCLRKGLDYLKHADQSWPKAAHKDVAGH